MLLAQPRSYVRDLVVRQVGSLYPLGESEVAGIDGSLDAALERCDRAFSRVRNKYYREGGDARFDPLHGCQWAFFLYVLSNSLHHAGEGSVCDKVYALSKAMCGADLFYQVELPGVFTFDHPLGAVMGRASYSDYFSFGQGCTVGNNHGIYPTFGESVFMMSDSKVVGSSRIGDNVIISANSFVKDEVVPSGSIVFGQSPNLTIKEGKLDYVREYAESVFIYG
ncbi:MULTISPECIES: transferase [unclassified Adlercreutzia]|uniref:transferase n=1 Tax=unclassified Adlercreutzia TaxID=2636013 RepID=UPI001F152E12|nr:MULTISPECIES: transferase [unclassified Adlercreutzia]